MRKYSHYLTLNKIQVFFGINSLKAHPISFSDTSKTQNLQICYCFQCISAGKIERLLLMVEDKASSSKIDEAKLVSYIEKVPIWEFEGISGVADQQFSKDQKKEISICYYDAMTALLNTKLCFFFLVYFWKILCSKSTLISGIRLLFVDPWFLK